jgi:hypothetical protein
MMSRSLLSILAACLLIAEPRIMNAQDHTYDGNALRIDARLGEVRIVRGVDGPVVGQIGIIRGADVATIVSSSPNAVAEAREFQRNYRPGVIGLGLGLIALGASVGVSQIHDVNHGITTGLTIVTVGLITYGGTRLQRAYNALSRSIWWYNRDLR